MSSAPCVINLNKKAILDLYSQGLRGGKRTFNEYRPINIECGVISKAEGSAKVTIGETMVIAGVKMKVGKPFPDRPDAGVLITNAEFTPIASPQFESGPPGADAVELARVVDRGIRESDALDVSKLCIEPKEAVWEAWLDLYIFNHRGNMIDACSLASIAALLTAKIPKYEDEQIIYEETTGPLPVTKMPIMTTVGKTGNTLFVDPDLDEESLMQGRVSTSVLPDNAISAMQKGGSAPFTWKEIEQCIDYTFENQPFLTKLVSDAVKNFK